MWSQRGDANHLHPLTHPLVAVVNRRAGKWVATAAMIPTLITLLLLHDAKIEMTTRYPDRAVQIARVSLPSIAYRSHIWFDWGLKSFVAGKCDQFARRQVQVVRSRRIAVTIARLYHELRHWVVDASGSDRREHKRIDRHYGN